MEKVYQSVNADGLQIPLALMRQYGLERGSGVVLELRPDGIHVIPARPEQTAIENRALRYLLSTVGDSVRVKAKALPDDEGWQVEVYGLDLTQPMGILIYSLTGDLLSERSTSPTEIRQAVNNAANQS
jgi:antitoxin component of MazEF toxin-antitoxin module